jgi:hypothetical protein
MYNWKQQYVSVLNYIAYGWHISNASFRMSGSSPMSQLKYITAWTRSNQEAPRLQWDALTLWHTYKYAYTQMEVGSGVCTGTHNTTHFTSVISPFANNISLRLQCHNIPLFLNCFLGRPLQIPAAYAAGCISFHLVRRQKHDLQTYI